MFKCHLSDQRKVVKAPHLFIHSTVHPSRKNIKTSLQLSIYAINSPFIFTACHNAPSVLYVSLSPRRQNEDSVCGLPELDVLHVPHRSPVK